MVRQRVRIRTFAVRGVVAVIFCSRFFSCCLQISRPLYSVSTTSRRPVVRYGAECAFAAGTFLRRSLGRPGSGTGGQTDWQGYGGGQGWAGQRDGNESFSGTVATDGGVFHPPRPSTDSLYIRAATDGVSSMTEFLSVGLTSDRHAPRSGRRVN